MKVTNYTYKKLFVIITLVLNMTISQALLAAVVKVAVASNFTAAAKQMGTDFENKTGHKVVISFGSTGKLYTQILYHAPFDVFLSADQARPKLLEVNNLADQRFTYALGKLVLWTSDKNSDLSQNSGERLLKKAILNSSDSDFIVLINLRPLNFLDNDFLYPTSCYSNGKRLLRHN